jgi:hypothetical protein
MHCITTTTTTTIPPEVIPEMIELPQELSTIDNAPFYQSISGNLTSVRVVSASPSVVIQEVSFIDKAFMRDIGNVTNIGTFVDHIDPNNGTIVHGIGKGIITLENEGGDMITWNSYDLGLTSYGNGNATAVGDGLDRETITTYRGIVFNANSERLSFMNNIVGLYMTQVINGNGSGLGKVWEWRIN